MTVRLAMWSGPRNISTAMMRAWGNRADTCVIDEPFYASYLHATGADHPMRDSVIESQSTDWGAVAKDLTDGPVPAQIHYQKHMTHHMIPGIDLGWTRDLVHCFLIRDPLEVVGSYGEKRTAISADDIGVCRQLELYREIGEQTGQCIPVVDGRRFLEDPERALRSLCERLGVSFDPNMLHWPAGARESDGVWAAHWYESVEASSGFRPYRAPERTLSDAQRRVAEESMPAYEVLLALAETG